MADEQTEEIPTQDTTEEQPTEAEQATTQEETAPPAEDSGEQQAAEQETAAEVDQPAEQQEEEAAADETGQQAVDEEGAQQENQEQTEAEAAPEQETQQESTEQTNEETTVTEQATDDAEPQQTADDAEPQQTADDAEPQQAADDAEPQQTADDAEPQQAADDAEPQQAADDAEPQQTADDAEPQQAAVENPEQTSLDPAEQEQAQPVPSEQAETTMPKTPEPTQASLSEAQPPTETVQAQEPMPEAPPPTETVQAQEPTQTAASTGASVPAAQEAEVNPYAPSPEPKFAKDATCTVKLMLMPSAQVHTMRCGLLQTLKELKDHFSKEIKVSPDILMFMFNGKPMDNSYSLADLGVGPNGTVQLEITSSDPSTPLKPIRPKVEYQMPDVITVRVQTENGEWQDIVVEIERATRKKPFLGGYRHKTNSVEYHHASAQTAQKPKAPSLVEKNCRDTQTYEQKHIVQQTTNDMSTQMTKIGVYVTNMTDKLVVPGKYTTADEYHGAVNNRVLCIQKYYRRWLAKRYVEKVRSDKARRDEWERQEEMRKRKEKEDRIKKEFERRMNPKSKEDFDLLYHALEKWRQEEHERINMELSGAERKAALCELLDQETQLIASIGRHKIDADTENISKEIQHFLDKAAAPKKWKAPDGKNTEMDTPYTIRAQELRDIYNSINMKYLTQDERLDVLLTLKHTVKEHDCKLTQEIIELIDREADLLMRGVRETNLDGLRKRIATLFLQYIKTPTFNPEAARLLKVPQDASVLRKDIYFCPSCNQYKPSTEFQLSSNSRTVGRCHKCNKIDNDARIRHDYSHYRFMLKTLRRIEQAYADGSQIAFLLQEADLRYLVENVWNSQSVLSAWEDLYDLVLVRWDKHTEWSPWNCILITKEEAASHDKLDNLDEAYGKTLIHKVKHKHTLARNYFSRLPGMAEYMRSQLNSGSVRGPSISGKGLSVAPPVGVH